MSEEPKNVKIPLSAAIFLGLFIACAFFFLGATVNKTPKTTADSTSKNVFAATKTDKPEFNFFVMSFCPYGNQMETTLRPVFDLLGNKVDIHPRYIFEKIEDLSSFCKASSGDVTQCENYIKNPNAPFKTVAECKKFIDDRVKQCGDEKAYIKSGNSYYASLHGRQEANQDVREICAYNLTDNKKAWWDFVDNVNQSCSAQNVDTCWEEQAKKAGLDTNKITECFNKDAISLIENEIQLTTKGKIQGSPTLTINSINFPPETAYTQDGKGSLTINGKNFTQDQFRSPNTIKEAICASFKKAPKECQTELADPAAAQGNAAPATGGCGQ